MAGRKGFVAGEILTAADVNSFLMDQSVMVFDDGTARGSAIPSPTEGMVTYRKDADLVEAFDGSSFVRVGPAGIGSKVVQGVSTATFSTTSDSFTNVTGLSVTITPSSAAAKILLLADVKVSNGAVGEGVHVQFAGGNTEDYRGAAASNRVRGAYFTGANVANWSPGLGLLTAGLTFLDSPNTTSAVTYTVQIRRGSTSGTVHVNRAGVDTNNADFGRTASSIVAIEVS